MSGQPRNEGHWESHSSSSATTKIGDNPPIVVGKEASAEGSFDVSEVFFNLRLFCTIYLGII